MITDDNDDIMTTKGCSRTINLNVGHTELTSCMAVRAQAVIRLLALSNAECTAATVANGGNRSDVGVQLLLDLFNKCTHLLFLLPHYL